MSNGRDNVKRLMAWNKSELPAPFISYPHTNNSHVSKYTESAGIVAVTNRISQTNMKFLIDMYCAEEGKYSDDIVQLAIGGTVNEYMCEKCVNGNYEISIYNEQEKSITCFVVDGSTNKISADEKSVPSEVILGSLWEALKQDEEFHYAWLEFTSKMAIDAYDEAYNAASILNDNIYRRINGEMIEINGFNQNVNEVKIERSIASGQYSPTSVELGEFRFLRTPDAAVISSAINLDDFIGKYPIDENRVYTDEEKQLMKNNELEDFYIIDNDDIEICNDIVQTSKCNKPFRNFVLVGPPGGGKSSKVKAVANGIILPEVIHCCNPSTEIFEFVGQIMPPSHDCLEKEAWNMAAKLEEMGGINFKNIAKLYELPVVEDILVDPEGVYQDITKRQKTPLGKTPTVTDAVKAWTEYMQKQFSECIKKLRVAMKEGAGFTFTETDFIRSVKNGWVCEIQEPNVILNEGVLVGLNSILNEGIITLQTGETIRRHKDSVIIFTTNNDLYGLRNMNQSFLDRAAETFYVDRPPVPVVADRIMSVSGLTNRKMAIEMAKLGEVISDAMYKEGIEDGVCGMRSLINWAIKCSYANPYEAAIKTVINKTSMDAKNRNRLMKKLDESWFYQFRGK